MSTAIQAVLLLIVGWLLGLLGPAIVDGIRRQREATNGRRAIHSELDELRKLLIFSAFQARKSAGAIDRNFLEWLKKNLSGIDSAEARSLMDVVRAGLSATPEELVEAAHLMKTPADQATILQHYPAPLLDARVAALWSFESRFQRQLLEIKKDLHLLADVVGQSREFFRLSFTQMSEANHDLATVNLEQSYRNYAQRAEIIVDNIARLS